MFPIKFITKRSIIASNHHALYIKFLVSGVGDVSWPASMNVPIAIATANTTNNTPVSLLENNIFLSVFIKIFMGYKFNTILTFFIPNYIIYFVNFN